MVLTYRSLLKTYPLACQAIVGYAHKNQLLFEAALEAYFESIGISVEVEWVRDKKRSNKIVGYTYGVQLKSAIGPLEPALFKDEKVFTRDLYAWQEGVREALRLLEDGLAIISTGKPVEKKFISIPITKN